jgi:Uma2 family endonuclease
MTAASVANSAELDPGQRVVLPRVSWDTYERLLADHADRGVPRFTYDRGVLEIVSPSGTHERRIDWVTLLVNAAAEELGIDIAGFGSTTFRRQDLERGFEPDASFYVEHEADVREQTEIDLNVDPPPDLVVEIDVANSSLDKLPIYAQLGIPEVWRGEGGRLRILRRRADGGGYDEVATSRALPPLTADVVNRWLAESQRKPRTAWLRGVRSWVRAQGAAGEPEA